MQLLRRANPGEKGFYPKYKPDPPYRFKPTAPGTRQPCSRGLPTLIATKLPAFSTPFVVRDISSREQVTAQTREQMVLLVRWNETVEMLRTKRTVPKPDLGSIQERPNFTRISTVTSHSPAKPSLDVAPYPNLLPNIGVSMPNSSALLAIFTVRVTPPVPLLRLRHFRYIRSGRYIQSRQGPCRLGIRISCRAYSIDCRRQNHVCLSIK